VSGTIVLTDDVIYDSLVVKDAAGTTTYVLGTDYLVTYDNSENCVITPISTAAKAQASLKVNYDKIDWTGFPKTNIIGGYSSKTDAYTGLEAIDLVNTMFQMVPGFILAPGFSHMTDVATIMKAKAAQVDGRFACYSVHDVDVSATGVLASSGCASWKNV